MSVKKTKLYLESTKEASDCFFLMTTCPSNERMAACIIKSKAVFYTAE